jgi:formylmethanofuran dehydrogenase subunit E
MSDRDVLIDAFKFHGHTCWASAIGARAGIAALRELGVKRAGTSAELHCILEIGDNHGAQCFADGVQYATGCTLGKFNVEKTGWGKLAATVIDTKRERSIRVSYKPTRHELVAESEFMRQRGQGIPPSEIPGAVAWEMVNILWEAPEDAVLSVGEVKPHPFESFGEIMGLRPCAECGELVAIAYLRVVGDRHVCIPCSSYER